MTGPLHRDLFILHAEADVAFVRSYLIPALELERERFALSSDLPLGMSIIQALESGVVSSKITLIIVSTALLHDDWLLFGEDLASFHALRGGRLVPLLLQDCTIPLRLDFRISVDCRDVASRPEAIAKLRHTLDPERLHAPAEPADLPCPYPGMRAYTAENAALFGGRSEESERIFRGITGGMRELFVIGPSGSGKSSLMHAGVLPRLRRRGDARVPVPFEVHVLRPGDAPAQRLEEIHRRAAAVAAPILVVIDQLEEIFTLAAQAARAAFFAKLEELRRLPHLHLAYLLRADFYEALMLSELWSAVERSQCIDVAPLRGARLREAIVGPARKIGVDLEPALLDRLMRDAAEEPGALPLIQETLVHLWSTRSHKLLTAASYEQLGRSGSSGIGVALANRADIAFNLLSNEGRTIARYVFLRLVSFGEGRADTRRQQPLSTLRNGEPSADFASALDQLIEARLLTSDRERATGETLIDLSHEALIASWPRLQVWINTHRQNEQLRRALEWNAREWAHRPPRGSSTVGLLDEGELQELEGWLTAEVQSHIGIGEVVVRFIAASRAAAQARSDASRAAEDSAAAMLAQLQHTAEQRAWSDIRLRQAYLALGRILLIDDILPLKALPYLVEVARLGERSLPLRILLRAATKSAHARLLFRKQSRARTALPAPMEPPASTDPTDLPELTASSPASKYDSTTGMTYLRLQHEDAVTAAGFSPDGTRVFTASLDHTLQLWNATTGQPLFAPMQHADRVLSASFSRDGDLLVTASIDRTARIWNARTGELLQPPLRHDQWVRCAAFSPSSETLATSQDDGTVLLWLVARRIVIGRPITHKAQVHSLAFSPDGTRLLTASYDTTARIWDAATGKPLSPPMQHGDWVQSAAFSPNGHLVITASYDRAPKIWDSAGKLLVTLPDHGSWVRTASFSPNGGLVVTASEDSTARIWETSTGASRSAPLYHESAVRSAAFSPDGTCVVTASDDGTARIWETSTGAPISPPLRHSAPVSSATFSPDGASVLTATDDGTVHVWCDLLDCSSFSEWDDISQLTPYVLINGLLSVRSIGT